MRLLRSHQKTKGISIHSNTNPTESYFSPIIGGQVRVSRGVPITTHFNGNFTISGMQIFGTPAGFNDDILSVATVIPHEPQTATEWVNRNAARLTKYAGQYVAITNKGIVAVTDDFEAIYAKTKKKGIINPLVFKIPKAVSRSVGHE